MSQRILPLEKAQEYSRTISFQSIRKDENHLQVTASLRDHRHECDYTGNFSLHHMEVRLTLNKEWVITDADFATEEAPFNECRNYRVGPEKLVGVSAGPGFVKRLTRIYGRTSGCSHILSLLIAMSPAIHQAMAFCMWFPNTDREINNREDMERACQQMGRQAMDYCMSWAEDSEVQSDLAKGDVRGLDQRCYPRGRARINKKSQ